MKSRTSGPPLRWLNVAAAMLLAAVAFSVPTLAYVHDHLTTADDTAHFRPGKNIERPHEQQSSIVVAALAASTIDPGFSEDGLAAMASPRRVNPFAGAPSSPRAPPVR